VSTSSPAWLRHILALLGVAVSLGFAGLALWQSDRGDLKAGWLEQVEEARRAPPRELSSALRDPALVGLPVTVEGRVVLRTQTRLLLDNQQREGRVGVREYVLVRPHSALADQPWLLLDLGWLLLPADRVLPELAPLPGELDARGLLTDLPGQGLRLGSNPAPSSAVNLLGYLDVDELGDALGIPIAARLLRLDPAVAIGHARDLDVLPNTLPPERHKGYALQWAGLGLAALVITLLLYFRSRG